MVKIKDDKRLPVNRFPFSKLETVFKFITNRYMIDHIPESTFEAAVHTEQLLCIQVVHCFAS